MFVMAKRKQRRNKLYKFLTFQPFTRKDAHFDWKDMHSIVGHKKTLSLRMLSKQYSHNWLALNASILCTLRMNYEKSVNHLREFNRK